MSVRYSSAEGWFVPSQSTASLGKVYTLTDKCIHPTIRHPPSHLYHQPPPDQIDWQCMNWPECCRLTRTPAISDPFLSLSLSICVCVCVCVWSLSLVSFDRQPMILESESQRTCGCRDNSCWDTAKRLELLLELQGCTCPFVGTIPFVCVYVCVQYTVGCEESDYG